MLKWNINEILKICQDRNEHSADRQRQSLTWHLHRIGYLTRNGTVTGVFHEVVRPSPLMRMAREMDGDTEYHPAGQLLCYCRRCALQSILVVRVTPPPQTRVRTTVEAFEERKPLPR